MFRGTMQRTVCAALIVRKRGSLLHGVSGDLKLLSNRQGENVK